MLHLFKNYTCMQYLQQTDYSGKQFFSKQDLFLQSKNHGFIDYLNILIWIISYRNDLTKNTNKDYHDNVNPYKIEIHWNDIYKGMILYVCWGHSKKSSAAMYLNNSNIP